MTWHEQVVLKVGAEGGSITLWGRGNAAGQWSFALERNESALADFLRDEDDMQLLTRTRSKRWLDTWEEALERLNAYSWPRLHPLKVHDEFRDRVWHVVRDSGVDTRRLHEWREVCDVKEVDTEEQIRVLANWMKNSRVTVVLTGAGMSTESGVPDFRSQSGWWRNIDPTTVATVEALEENYTLFHEFYSMRIRALEGLHLNVGHRILADLERMELVHTIATQNVDGFHQLAGSQNVSELHGSIRSCRCYDCGEGAVTEDFLQGQACIHCGGPLRPNVVLFDEMLPQDAWQKAVEAIVDAELVIVIGSSLNVYPANQLPVMTKGKTVAINLEPTAMDDKFDLVIHAKAGEVLQGIVEEFIYN